MNKSYVFVRKHIFRDMIQNKSDLKKQGSPDQIPGIQSKFYSPGVDMVNVGSKDRKHECYCEACLVQIHEKSHLNRHIGTGSF